MSLCSNTLTLSGPASMIHALLRKGFEQSDVDDWGLSPQNFSFKPFIDQLEGNGAVLENLWTSWIEEKETPTGHRLVIEFESDNEPPLPAINALIHWLNSEAFNYQLSLKYRDEHGLWSGELRAKSPTH